MSIMMRSCKLIIFVFIITFSHRLYAEEINLYTQDSIPETLPDVKKTSKHALFMGSGYGSNLLFAGSSMSDNMDFLSADLTYSFMKNLWASVIFYNLPGNTSTIPLYDISAGYNYTLNDWFDFSTSLTSFQAAASMQEVLYPSFAYFRFALGVDWMLLYTRTSLGKILEKDTGIYLYIKNSRYFSTPEFGRYKSYFSFDPSVNLFFGNYSQLETIPLTTQRLYWQRNSTPTESEVLTTSFKLTQIEFSVPVAFSIGKFGIEAEPLYLFPTINDESYSSLKGFHFFFNLYYQIF